MADLDGTEEIARHYEQLLARLEAGVEGAASYFGRLAEQRMRTGAKWRDHTTAARRGLQAVEQFTQPEKAVYLTSQVDYGKWLELKSGGRYAIIVPTATAEAGTFATLVNAAVERELR